LNSTDAAILTMLLDLMQSPVAPSYVLVAADQRLLRAAHSEGVRTLDPQAMSSADVPTFLASF